MGVANAVRLHCTPGSTACLRALKSIDNYADGASLPRLIEQIPCLVWSVGKMMKLPRTEGNTDGFELILSVLVLVRGEDDDVSTDGKEHGRF